MTEGKNGDRFFVLESGAMEITKRGAVVGALGPGTCFGELALVYEAPRKASIAATEDSSLWWIDRKSFRAIMATAHQGEILSRVQFLKRLAIFRQLNDLQLTKVAAALTESEPGQYQNKADVIFRQGDPGQEFYIITEGRVAVRDDERATASKTKTLKILRKGDYFGEMALLTSDARRTSTCLVARGPVKMLQLTKQDFEKLLGPIKPWLDSATALRIFEVSPSLKALPAGVVDALAQQAHVFIPYISSFPRQPYSIIV